MKMKKAFTLMELLIVIVLLVILATALLVSLNPFGQINKSQDSKRKSELSSLVKVLEDWYNDKNCYPKAQDICYDTVDSNNSCHVCGPEPQSPSFSPYLSSLPCDPRQPSKKYLYQTDGSSCPGWYIMYTSLSNSSDPVISEVGCQNGCGPPDNINYNYFLSSSNIILEEGIGPTTNPPNPTATSVPNPTSTPNPLTPTATPSISSTPTPTPTPTGIAPSPTPTIVYVGNCSTFATLFVNPNCNACGDYAACKAIHPGETYYTDVTTCVKACFPD